MRRTKIVCTIGPTSKSSDILQELMIAGMNVARLNFSHGTHETHLENIQRIRDISHKNGLPIAILQDLAGPKIRVGKFAKDVIYLKTGQRFVLTSEKIMGDDTRVSVSYSRLPNEVKENDQIFLADGSIELKVSKIEKNNIACQVVVAGKLSSNQGINLSGSTLSIEALTDKDIADLNFGLKNDVDYVALSFVRKREDILHAKEIMKKQNKFTPIIAKIEKHEALENIDEIIDDVDGIMVARGDLAIETSLEQVPLVQKMLIQKCNKACKPVITATQMLKSMVDNPRPTRAEANDVANAVFDGTDAVMLSEETAIGQYPAEAVKTMSKIIQVTEASSLYQQQLQHTYLEATSIDHAVSHGAFAMAQGLKAAAIITPTQSGSTARMVSSYRPGHPIIALSPDQKVIKRLALVWGVYPIQSEGYYNTEEMMEEAKDKALKSGLVNFGDVVVITAGVPIGVPGTTNLIKVEILK